VVLLCWLLLIDPPTGLFGFGAAPGLITALCFQRLYYRAVLISDVWIIDNDG
jgi:hypothetical protein